MKTIEEFVTEVSDYANELYNKGRKDQELLSKVAVSGAPFDASIGAWIKEERIRQGIKQYALAIKAHISPQALSMIETGRRYPTVNSFNAILNALGWQTVVIRRLDNAK